MLRRNLSNESSTLAAPATLVLLVVAFLFGTALTGFAGVLEDVKEKGVLVVSTDANYAPQSFLNEKGELDGFDIDVAKEVAKRLGVAVKFVTPDWDLIVSGKWGGAMGP